MNIKKTVSSSLAGIVLLTAAATYAVGMDDISGHWAEKSIEMLEGERIVGGYPDGTFRPDSMITRAEASKVISGYIGGESESTVSFKDVEGHWSINFIGHLLSENIISGYPDKTFRPESQITRGEFATMVCNYLEERGISVENPSGSKFRDVEGHWAGDSIDSVATIGYVDGYPDGTFRPDEFITRAEVAKIVAEMYQDKVPELEGSWTENHEANMDIFIDELGFDKDRSGNWNGVESFENPIGVYGDNPELYEASIVLREWQTDEVEGSYKIPLVFYELLKFYFEDEADYAYSKMDDVEVSEFSTSDRFVRIKDEDGKVFIYIGYKNREKFDIWW